ncbi:MAG TPA: hypothetical protein VM101_01875, partial [Flavitalea sp.]|nr:hypothetical protein [Flavitalea sp.]
MPRTIFALLLFSYFFLPGKFNSTSFNNMQIINYDVANVSGNKALPGERTTATSEKQIRVITALQLFDDWVSRDVVLSAKDHIELEYGETYEDDGAAAGHSYTPNIEELSDIVWARKELIVPDPSANKAILLLQHTGNPVISINDHKIGLQPVKGGGKAWNAYEFDPHLLR